jgi:hypothetical protein
MPIVEKNMERAKEDKEQNGCKQKKPHEKNCVIKDNHLV